MKMVGSWPALQTKEYPKTIYSLFGQTGDVENDK
jgi:hypothetical protein